MSYEFFECHDRFGQRCYDSAASSRHFFKVYIRHAKEFPAARDIVSQRLGGGMQVIYPQADICRLDLLFEIEGILST